MPDKIDDEVEAIKAVLKALESLTPDARSSVAGYVLKRLGIAVSVEAAFLGAVTSQTPAGPAEAAALSTPIHLEDLKKQKNPKSASEMAALVAFYLSELAPSAQRKKTVTAADIKTYFKIGGYPLPEVQFTLPNAKQAGYFDAVGNGEYRLNAVGYNLVAHSLPRSKDGAASGRKPRKKKVNRK